MNTLAINLILLTICIINVIRAENKCFLEEQTWSSEGQLEILPQVSFEQCIDALLHNENGQGLTFYRSNKFNRFQDLCIIFGKIDEEHACTDCTSIKLDDSNNCGCNTVDGECQIEDGNFIGGKFANSEFQCWLDCVANTACKYYTWFGPENEDVTNECFLFLSCLTVNQCNGDCYVGQVHCDEPDPCSDMEYFPLYDGTRNVNYNDVDNFCDASNHNYTSHDWHGPNWYRMFSPAGSKIPETPVAADHCNTAATGWLNGAHPTILDETVNRTVCFNYSENTCPYENEIKIRNCGDYFLYYLPEVPGCYARYCSE